MLQHLFGGIDEQLTGTWTETGNYHLDYSAVATTSEADYRLPSNFVIGLPDALP